MYDKQKLNKILPLEIDILCVLKIFNVCILNTFV